MGITWILRGILILCLPGLSWAANHQVLVQSNQFSPANLQIQVGDTVTFTNIEGVHNVSSDPGAATSFRCARGCDGAGGNGNPSATTWTSMVTFNTVGSSPYHCEVHGGIGGIGMSGVITVVAATPPPPVARDDRVRVRMNSPPVDVAVLANDLLDAAAMAGGSLAIVQAPAVGSASVLDGGTPATAADDQLRVTLPVDAAGEMVVGYRVCDGSAQCDDGELRVVHHGLRPSDLSHATDTDGGFHDIALAGLPAFPNARYETTALVVPATSQVQIVADATPGTPWDNGRAGTILLTGVIPAPADGLPQNWGVAADAVPLAAGNVDLFVGLDMNLDGQPSPGELRCTAAMSAGLERCDMAVGHPGSGNVQYWVMVQNIGGATLTARVDIASVRLRQTAGGLSLSGPGQVAEDAAFKARLGWYDPGQLPGEPRFGFAVLKPVPEVELGWVPVRIDRLAGAPGPHALASGVDFALRLAGGGAHERIYIDVPPGMTSLVATTTSAANVDLYLARAPADPDPASPQVAAAPARVDADASATTASGNESITVPGGALAPGRWYVTPVNTGGAAADVVVRATLAGTAPVVRPGSYFNPDRSGHGLFMYPAATQRVVIWYTYFEDGTPTWLYLQGAQPGPDGSWHGLVYRSSWNGSANVLRQVGRASLSPTGPDAFRFSYQVDGRAGSEPMAWLGRGCPNVTGTPRDASSNWYDPATAGTGYSVQLWDDYEFIAAFVYDGQGTPRFLLAENPAAGPDAHTLALAQLAGFCPLCARTGAPTRQTIGTLTRTFSGGDLVRIEVDGVYAGAVPGAWTGDDMVQPLGGPASLQGCD